MTGEPLPPAAEQMLRDFDRLDLGADDHDEIAARLWLITREARAAALADVTAAVEGLKAYHPHEAPYVGGDASLPCHATQCAGGMRLGVLAAIKELENR